MSDGRIQDGLSLATPGGPAGDSEAIVDQLMRRVQGLEEEKRRWKRIGITAMLLLVLGFVVGTVVTVGGGATIIQIERREATIIEGLQNQQVAEVERLQAKQAEVEKARAELRAMQKQMQVEHGILKALYESRRAKAEADLAALEAERKVRGDK